MANWGLRLAAFALFLPAALASAQAPSPTEALALEQQGNLEEAARVWQSITERNPRDAGDFAPLWIAKPAQPLPGFPVVRGPRPLWDWALAHSQAPARTARKLPILTPSW